MVCILCDSKTKVTNSRYRRAFRQTWRRHTCTRCSAVFTTRESVDTSANFRVVYDDGSMEPFDDDRLFLSIYRATQHRPNGIQDARILTSTIIKQLIDAHSLRITRGELIDTTHKVLLRFNKGSGTIYATQVQLH